MYIRLYEFSLGYSVHMDMVNGQCDVKRSFLPILSVWMSFSFCLCRSVCIYVCMCVTLSVPVCYFPSIYPKMYLFCLTLSLSIFLPLYLYVYLLTISLSFSQFLSPSYTRFICSVIFFSSAPQHLPFNIPRLTLPSAAQPLSVSLQPRTSPSICHLHVLGGVRTMRQI